MTIKLKIKIIGRWNFKKIKCSVCNLEIKEDESVIYCPYCQAPAHRDHLYEWIRVRGYCPNCRRRLSLAIFR